MSQQSVARQYAGALFTVAQRNKKVDVVARELGAFAALVEGSRELREVFASPLVHPKKKRAVVDAILAAVGQPVSEEISRTVILLAERDRLALVADVSRAFADKVMESDRTVQATVVTADALPDERRQALADALGRATGRRVNVTSRVDPSIVGGLVAEVGSVVFDGSVAGQLNRMRQRVAADL
jgi:F-type H+-transporting ATPase subunit delta